MRPGHFKRLRASMDRIDTVTVCAEKELSSYYVYIYIYIYTQRNTNTLKSQFRFRLNWFGQTGLARFINP